MKNIKNIIETVQYATYNYDNIEEKENHIKQMQDIGFELLDNFESNHQVTFRKFLDEN